MKKILISGVVLGLSGCEKITEIQDTVEGLTESFVVAGIYLGVEKPDALDLEGTDFQGARLTAFLADAGQISEIESAPISGVAVEMVSDGNGGLVMNETGGGKYELSSDDGLTYVSGELAGVSADYKDEEREITVDVPPAPEVDVDTQHEAGTSLTIDLTGQGFDAAMVVVIDVESGEITWSNEPEDITALYEMTHPGGVGLGEDEEGDDSLVVEVPAAAFGNEAYYALGVAGMQVSDPADFVGINTALSTLMAGKLKFTGICTGDYSVLCQ